MNPPDVYHQYEESDTSLPVTEYHTPGHQGGTVERKERRVTSQEAKVGGGHASDSLTYKQKFDIKTIVYTQIYSFVLKYIRVNNRDIKAFQIIGSRIL